MTSGRSADRGELAIVLHSHMPYVEGFGTWPFGEEWLLEAIAASYLPLLRVLEAAAERAGQGVATVGMTPVLADQLAVPELGARFLRFMRDVRRECHRQDAEGLDAAGRHADAQSLRRSARDYEWAAEDFERRGGDLLGPLRRLHDTGAIELWASAATHAVLPMLATEQGVRLQVATGIGAHRACFGSWSGGFWLPECAYRPGIEEPLAAAGVRVFCVDQTGHGDPMDQLEPVAAGGAVAMPIDWPTIALIWDEHGYPADPAYRDYHAQTVNGMRAWTNGGEPYDHDAAAVRAREHAQEFVDHVIARAGAYRAARARPALVVCALDTELLGHWWYEGPRWLEEVFAHAAERGLRLTTLPAALERRDPVARPIAESSWGTEKDLRTWDSPPVADFVWAARQAELDLVAALASAERRTLADRAGTARRAARELLALQASDWSFMRTRELAGEYPAVRVRNHASRFGEAITALRQGMAHFRAMQAGTRHDGTANGQVNAAFDEHLRGLAPGLELAPLLEPASAWGRG
jgi:1,4-alpha-glucan branching enzyme